MKEIATHLSFVALVALLLWPNSAFGQQQVSGTVRDATGALPLPGVNVVIKGTAQGTATDLNGAYELTVPSLSDTLVFSFIGFEQQEVPISGRTQIDVELVEATLDLSESGLPLIPCMALVMGRDENGYTALRFEEIAPEDRERIIQLSLRTQSRELRHERNKETR